MAPCFTTLPVDVLLDIYQHLPIIDILRVSRTCKWIRDSTNERSLWIKLFSDRWTLFASPHPSSLSTQALRQRVVRDAVLDAQWRKSSTRASDSRKVYRSRTMIRSANLLSGGQYLVIVDSTGVVNIISTMPDRTIPVHPEVVNFCPLTNKRQCYAGVYILPSSETEGRVFVDVQHIAQEVQIGAGKFMCAKHVMIHKYNLSGDLSSNKIVSISNIVLDGGMDVSCWRSDGLTYTCLHRYQNEQPSFLSCFEEEPTLSPSKLINSRFRLLELSTPFDLPQEMVMVSPRRVIVGGLLRNIAIYDLPQQLHHSGVGNRQAVSLSPIWAWHGTDASLTQSRWLSVSSVYNRASTPDLRMVNFVIADTLHSLVVSSHSEGEFVVREHEIVYRDTGLMLWLPVRLRTFWITTDWVSCTLSNATMTEPPVSGSFHVYIAPREMDSFCYPSVDESSGLVSFMIRDVFRESWVFVADINDL